MLVYVIALVAIGLILAFKVKKTNFSAVKTAMITVTVVTVGIMAGIVITEVTPQVINAEYLTSKNRVKENDNMYNLAIIMSGIIAAVIAGVVSLIVVNVKDRHLKKELYARTVSSNRMQWIKDVRKHIVDLIVLCKMKGAPKYGANNFESCRANILMRLNPDYEKNTYSKKLIDELEKMDFDLINKGEFVDKVKTIETIGQLLLKEAWERVKVEAGETLNKRKGLERMLKKIKKHKAKRLTRDVS